jgi:SAM-dependent methyltransferase
MAIERNYQPHLWPEGPTVGVRTCNARWELMYDLLEKHVAPDGTVVDVGSAQGWFPITIAQTWPDSFVISVEEDLDAASLQRELIAANGLANVRLLNDRWDGVSLHPFGVGVDVTLMLSVLHWMDDPAVAFKSALTMSECVIVESPDPGDEGACGQSKLSEIGEITKWMAQFDVAEVGLLGRVPRHTSHRDAWMVYAIPSSSSSSGSSS